MKTGVDRTYHRREVSLLALAMLGSLVFAAEPAMALKKPNIVMLMTDDTGWNDFGYMPGGGKALGHPTPNIDLRLEEDRIFAGASPPGARVSGIGAVSQGLSQTTRHLSQEVRTWHRTFSSRSPS